MKETKKDLAIWFSILTLLTGICFYLWNTDDSGATSEEKNEETSNVRVTSLSDLTRELDTANKVERAELVSEGLKLARERKSELISLAKKDPQRALGNMMPLDILAALPPEIRAESEIPFSATGSIDLRWETSIMPDGSLKCSHRNLAIVDGNSWEIAGSSYTDARQPMTNVPLNGYIVGDILLLQENGIRRLSPAEAAVSDKFFPDADGRLTDPVTGNTADPEIAVVIGGETFGFENPAIVEHVEETLSTAQNSISQKDGRELKHGFKWLPVEADSGSGSGGVVQASPFQDDQLDVLFIRAVFPDLLGEPVTKAQLETNLAAVKARVQDFSYSKATVNFTVTPTLYTLTTAASIVATAGLDGDNDTIIAEARAAASGDYTLTDYDVVAVFFPNLSGIPGSKITYGGLATIGGSDHWINGIPSNQQVSIILHEFGHNYGLFHANYLHPAMLIGGDYFGPGNVSLEYGDIFDRMGDGDKDSGWFSPYATSRLEWMPPAKVVEPTTSGTIRIQRFDHPDAAANPSLPLAIRVPMGGSRYNWVGLRQLYPATAGKAYIVGEGIYTDRPNLIDATPGSLSAGSPDRSDAALPVGSNFYDASAGVRFTTMAAGGNEPNQYIDVKIDFDSRVELASTNILVDETAGNAALVVNRTFNSSGACSVAYSTSDGSASSGTDYYATSGTLQWSDGDNSPRTIYVPIRPDSTLEGPETFTLTLSSPVNAVIALSQNIATVSILDAGNRLTAFAPPFFNNSVEAIKVLPDNKIIAGGRMNEGITGHITRFNTNGSEDSTFMKGSGFDGAGEATKVLAIARQTDGKLLVGGEFRSYNGTDCSMITRLNANGTVDSSFCTAIGTGASNRVHTIGIESNGKILIGGDFTTFNGVTANGIVRLTSTGARDVAAPFAPAFDFIPQIPPLIKSILVQDDGKVMIGGQFTLAATGNRFRFGIARLTSTATRDVTFDPGYGTHFYDANNMPPSMTNSVRTVSSIARQPDGKYLIGGSFSGYNDQAANFLIRIESNGARDATFTPPAITGGLFDYQVEDIMIHSSGRIFVSGRFAIPTGSMLALLPSGATDPDFNLLGGAVGPVLAAAEDSDHNIYFGGNFFTFAGSSSRPIVKVAGGQDPYSTWESSVFTPTQILTGNTDPEDDFDNDGILNIAEMAIGTSPTVANSAGTFAIAAQNLSLQTSGGSSQFLTASLERSAANVGVWLVAQFSDDLQTWLPANPTPETNSIYSVSESTSTRFTVTDKTASGPGVKRFVRFRAVVPN